MYCFRSSMPKFFIKTYGCQMNERDSEQVAHSLIARGYERVAHETEADVVLLNTCSVRDMADQKALGKMGMLGRLAKERPHMLFGFLGCMAQARGAELLKQIPHLDLVVGTQKFHRVGDYVDDLVARKRATLAAVAGRGPSISPFVQLLEAVSAIDGLERLRFTSPHPIGFRDDLIEAMSRLPKLAEHVHLPLQSGSNRILKAMHRFYTAEKYAELVGRIRAARPGIAITTDIIVGFPGETESDYKATRDLVEQLQFDNGFIFRYSPRRETPAATMLDQIGESVKEARNQDLLGIINASARCANERLVGTHVEVLCEGPSKTNPARLAGRTRTNKVVVFEAEENRIGKIFDVAIERANGFSLYGQPSD